MSDVERRNKLHLIPFFGGQKLATLTKAEVNEYIAARLVEDASNATINRELAIIKCAFALAEIQRPAFAMLNEDNVRQGFFEAEQLAERPDSSA